jgi:hypothetical protein
MGTSLGKSTERTPEDTAMWWKRIRKDLHADEKSRMHQRPEVGHVGIQELSGSTAVVGWAFNGMNG